MPEFVFSVLNVNSEDMFTIRGNLKPQVIDRIIDILSENKTDGCVVCANKTYTCDLIKKKLIKQVIACNRIKKDLLEMIGDCESSCGEISKEMYIKALKETLPKDIQDLLELEPC